MEYNIFLDNKRKTIIAIDPGKSGGIAIYSDGRATASKMPSGIKEFDSILKSWDSTYEDIIVFIEKVQAYGVGDDAPGKKFGINKMLKNYNQLLASFEINRVKYVEVYPISWQSTLKLKKKAIKGQPKETKTERKNRYKEYAERCFPEIEKVTHAIGDALCILQFSLVKIKQDPKWISDRMVKSNDESLF